MPLSSLRDRISAVKSANVDKQAKHVPRVVPDLSQIAEKFQGHVLNITKNDLETVPRETVLKMLIQKKLDEHFIFRVETGEGENYIQAMRQVLSRTRKKALKKKQQLDEFKMLIVGVEHKTDYDIITLVRTKTMSAHQESVYDEIMAAFTKQTGKNEESK